MALPTTYVEGFHYKNNPDVMQYRRLGQTDLQVSKIGLGGATIGGIYGAMELKEAQDLTVEALKRGINFIDTAFWYGQGKSEENLGHALKDVPREAYYIGTKVGRYYWDAQDMSRMFDFGAERSIKAVDDALQKLQIPYVDLIQIHDVEFAPSIDIILHETLPALQKVKDAGKARYIGITGYPLSVLKEIVEKSTVRIDTILNYTRATLHDSSFEDYIPFFKSKGIGILNGSPTSMGLLSSRGPQAWHIAPENIQKACKDAAAYAATQGVDIGFLANYFSFNFPGVDCTLSGINDTDMLMKNLKAACQKNLTDSEQACMQTITEKFLPVGCKWHWEGAEQEAYRKSAKRD